MKLFIGLVCALALSFLVGCSALQRNPDGTASPAGKAVVQGADAGQHALEGAASIPGITGTILGGLALLTGYGVKRLHDKLDDITPETPVVTTIPPK